MLNEDRKGIWSTQVKTKKDEEYIFRVRFHDGQITVKEIKNHWKIIRKVILIVLIVLIAISIPLACVYAYYRSGSYPLLAILDTTDVDVMKENVEKITVNCWATEHKDFEIKRSNREYIHALVEIWDIKVYFPHPSFIKILPVYGGPGTIEYTIYMKNGEVHTVLAKDVSSNYDSKTGITTQSKYSILSIDGKEYYAAYWRYTTLAGIAERAVNN
ncbi:MAG: hypothetical protein HFE63_00560 [Clostridiales bacterium]|nr:hypothetical protein [Clostridiales bacterium]